MIECGYAYQARPAARRRWLGISFRSILAVIYRQSHLLGALLGAYAIIFTYLCMAQMTHEKRVKEAERLMTLGLLDAESGQRAYLLTGDSAFLVQYQAGLKELATYELLYKSSLVDHRSKKSCMEVESLLKRKTDEMALTIAIHDKVSPAAALTTVSKRNGYNYTEAIYRMLLEIQKTESERVAPFQFWDLPADLGLHESSSIFPALSSL